MQSLPVCANRLDVYDDGTCFCDSDRFIATPCVVNIRQCTGPHDDKGAICPFANIPNRLIELPLPPPCRHRGEVVRIGQANSKGCCPGSGENPFEVLSCSHPEHMEDHAMAHSIMGTPLAECSLGQWHDNVDDCLTCPDRVNPDRPKTFSREWSIAITTAARKRPTLGDTIQSVINAGWELEPIVICADADFESDVDITGGPGIHFIRSGQQIGAARNMITAIHAALAFDAELIMFLQDDVVLCRGLREYLERALWPASNVGCVTLFNSTRYPVAHSMHGLVDITAHLAKDMLRGACALVFPREVAKAIVGHRMSIDWPSHDGADLLIGRVMHDLGLTTWCTQPSLAQHVGSTATLLGNNGASPHNGRAASDFVGEQTDIDLHHLDDMQRSEFIGLDMIKTTPQSFAVGVTTVKGREVECLATVGQVDKSFENVQLYIDGPTKCAIGTASTKRLSNVGAWPNWYLALQEMIFAHPEADAYLIFQDDCNLVHELGEYLSATWPRNASVVSMFCPECYADKGPGWSDVSTHGRRLAGAVALGFTREAARAFITDLVVSRYRFEPFKDHRGLSGDGRKHIDAVVGDFCKRTYRGLFVHWPSLVQHTGIVSTLYEGAGDSRRRSDRGYLGTGFQMVQPHVYCVMITGKDPERLVLAIPSIASFHEQTYQNRSLLVCSDLGCPVADILPTELLAHTNVIVLDWPSDGLTLGALRNRAIEFISDPQIPGLVMQWDDDDLYDRRRIEVQVSHWKPGHAVVLQNETLWMVDPEDTEAGFKRMSAANRACGGFEGTILHESTDPARYPSERLGEDTAFIAQFGNRVIAINNDPHMYVRCFNGHNSWDRKHYDEMGGTPCDPPAMCLSSGTE